MLQDFHKLTSLLGKSTDSDQWRQAQKSCTSPIVEQFGPDSISYSYCSNGIRFVVLEDVVFELWLYGTGEPNFDAFTSAIMDSVLFTDNRREVHKRIGAPSFTWLDFPQLHPPDSKSADDWRCYLSQSHTQVPKFMVDYYCWGPYGLDLFFDANDRLCCVCVRLFVKQDLIQTLIAAGQFEDAVGLLKEVIQDEPSVLSYMDYLELAKCYVQMSDFELAEHYYQIALESSILLTKRKPYGGVRLKYANFLLDIARDKDAFTQLLLHLQEHSDSNQRDLHGFLHEYAALTGYSEIELRRRLDALTG